MKNRSKILFVELIVFFLTFCFVFTAPFPGHTAEKDEFTDVDAKTLKSSDDPDAVADVIFKLSDIYEAQGKDGLKPAIPALLEGAYVELNLPEDERWNIYDIIKIISLTGDEKVKPFLLHIMSIMVGGGNPFTAQGFYSIGHSVVKDVADSLKSSSSDTKGRAALTLHKMFEFDDTGKFFTPEDCETIRKRLVENLVDENPGTRIYSVVALRSFGDESIINPLEQIEKYDAHMDSGGFFGVRMEATETLKHLRAKK
ncbi:hypothetical protein ACFL2X_03930 [Candidatus Latescibacterota bacterium]